MPSDTPRAAGMHGTASGGTRAQSASREAERGKGRPGGIRSLDEAERSERVEGSGS